MFYRCHAEVMAGGMTPKRQSPTLAERSALSGISTAQALEQPAVRHCWVSGLPDDAGRYPGLLAEWRSVRGQDGKVRWFGRVVYAVDGGDHAVLVEAWVPAEHLKPA